MLASEILAPEADHFVRNPCETPSLKCSVTWSWPLVCQPSESPCSSPLETDRSAAERTVGCMLDHEPSKGVGLAGGGRAGPADKNQVGARSFSRGGAARALAGELAGARAHEEHCHGTG